MAIFSGTYAYQAVARYGDDVSFTIVPGRDRLPQEGPCVAALQQLLNADPPHAGIYHDGIFGRRRWPPPGNSSPATACRPAGEPTAGTIRCSASLPRPAPVPVAAALLTVTLASIVVLGLITARRRRERGAAPGPPSPPRASAAVESPNSLRAAAISA
jgi:hypothetical protein